MLNPFARLAADAGPLKRQKWPMRQLGILAVAVLALGSCGDSTKEPPQMIEADGQTFVACGTEPVYISNEGSNETTFRVKFTDAAGMSHVVKGIRKLHVTQLPKNAVVCQPSERH
jgi:hypothetical protein